MEKELSPAAQFVSLVYNYSKHLKRGADNQWDGCQQDALRLAIRALLPFDEDDMAWIKKNTYFTWHAGNGDNWGEDYYSVACGAGNISAARSFEKMKGRKPFIWKWTVKHGGCIGRVERSNDRLSVGDEFICRNVKLSVTSFNDADGLIICCTYKKQERDERGYVIGPLKVEKLYKIDHKQLRVLADPSVGAPDLTNYKTKEWPVKGK